MTNDLVKMERRMWEAYAKQAGGVSFDGQPLPTWDELGEERQSCWIAAASVAAARIEELEHELRQVIEAWDWWQVDEFDRCASVPADAIREARATLKGNR